ncbi:hypothetical protein PVK06_026944 [Gossypium arboreum]|uniref:Uncharacterized protein n=1 Tax=Gossypium arboreum TaxID=29729 RepID=A0ABR0NYY6_GOSAR|nr:hypothetical protein PVK06_026944 [Gossypium arboreum]
MGSTSDGVSSIQKVEELHPLPYAATFLMTVIESPSTITSPNPISSTKTTPLRHAYASTVVESQTFLTGYHFHLLENLFRKITFLEDMVD